MAERIVGHQEMISRPIAMVFLVIVLTFNLISQDRKKNVVYLKNGRIISGTIIEIITDQQLKIITGENVVYTITYADISYVGNERMDYYSETTDTTIYARGITYSLFAGLALPADEFGDNSHSAAGYATSGTIIGAEVNFPLIRSLYVNATVAVISNGVDEGSFRLNNIPATITTRIENWTCLWILPGVRSQTTLGNVSLYASVNYGWATVRSPVIFLSDKYSALTSPSNSGTQSGYSVSIGGAVFDFFTFGIKYFHSEPSLPVTALSNPELLDPSVLHPTLPLSTYRQSVSIYTVVLGISF